MAEVTLFGKTVNLNSSDSAVTMRDHIVSKWRPPSDQDSPRGGDGQGGTKGGGIGAGNMSSSSSSAQYISIDNLNLSSFEVDTITFSASSAAFRNGNTFSNKRRVGSSSSSLAILPPDQDWGTMYIGNGGKKVNNDTVNAASVWAGTVEFNQVDGSSGQGGTVVYGGDIMGVLNLGGEGSTPATPKANDLNRASGTVRVTTLGGHDNIYGTGSDLRRSEFDSSIRVDTFTPGAIAKDKDSNINLRAMIEQDFGSDYSGGNAASDLDSFITSSIQGATWSDASVGDMPGKDVYMDDKMIRASSDGEWPLYQPNQGSARSSALDGGFPKMKKVQITSSSDPSKKRTYAVLDSNVSLVVPSASSEMYTRDSSTSAGSGKGKITAKNTFNWNYTGADKAEYNL